MFEVMKLELKLAGVSKHTVKAYVYHNQRFLDFTGKKPQYVNKADVVRYLLKLLSENKSERTIRLVISSLKFYYEKIMKRNILKNIQKPKIPKSLPEILEKEEIKKMIDVTKNKKHKLLLILLYSSGLRVSEALKITKQDINEKERIAMIRQGKGKKDRVVILSEVFCEEYKKYKNKVYDYLFVGRHGKTLSVRSAQKILENAARKAGINKNVHPHKLRASFATHLVDTGTDMNLVASLLGHSSVNTTKNSYVRLKTSHLKNIKSPLDS